MPRRSDLPLDSKGFEIRFFKGDLDELRDILSKTSLKPTEFIRELLHKSIRRIKERAALKSKAVEIGDEEIELR